MFHSFFNSLARSRYLSLFSHSFSFILWSAGTTKSTILQIIIIIIIIIMLIYFIPANADRRSVDSEWQQVSSGLQDSSEYFGYSQLWWHLDSFHFSSDFQFY